jgi:putative Ca2+/H+ antiporter (TMEM165/GDT1 family)
MKSSEIRGVKRQRMKPMFIFAAAMMTVLMVSTILAVPVTAQGSSSSENPTSSLDSAKTHLIEAMKDIKTGNSQAASTQINMTDQGIILAQARLNATEICNNVKNEGFCAAPPSLG